MNSSNMRQGTPRYLYAFIALYIALSFVYEACGAGSLILGYYDLRHQVRAPFALKGSPARIAEASAAAKQVGVSNGDILEAIDGAPFRGEAQLQGARWRAKPGESIVVSVRKANGSEATTAIPLLPFPPRHVPLQESVFIILLQVVIPLACLLAGYWVVLARPADPNAWLILVLLSFPTVFITVSTFNWFPGPWLVLRLFWHIWLEIAAIGALFLLGLQFPERSRIDRRAPWFKFVFLAALGWGFLVATVTDYSHWYNQTLLPNGALIEQRNDTWINWLLIVSLGTYAVTLVDQLRTATTSDSRRRLRVLLAGTVVGLGSTLLIWGLLPFFGIDPAKKQVLAYIASVLMLAFPFSLAYVVLVQRAMDVSILVRTGTRYLLARTTLFVIQFGLFALVLFQLVIPVLRRNQEKGLPIILGVSLTILVVRLNFVRRTPFDRVREWLDRRFFREQYNAELVLAELAERVRRVTDPAALIGLISSRISEVMHVPQMAVMLRQGNQFALSSGGTLMLPEASVSIQHLAETSSPAVLYRDRPADWFSNAGSGERSALDELKAEVLIPLPGRSRLMGVMVLGPKLSEEPYSPTDLRLLQSVAVQAGMGLEINDLAQSLASEAARHQMMQREVEIAREVQERLFPQKMPCVPGTSLAGHCRAALGVGGDYYDMIEFEDGRLGLVIGDVSGKGIAAALLMASLRASLRGMTADGAHDLALMMKRLNRLVYESSAVNRYATFFFAVYDPASRLLEYVNGGHNPPLVVRANETLRLEASGTVIGLLRDAEFEAMSVQLKPGDVFVGYTDGISEAMTVDDEEWGEERMLAATRCDLEPAGILRHIFEDADTFTAGAPQHDDMTVLIMKLT